MILQCLQVMLIGIPIAWMYREMPDAVVMHVSFWGSICVQIVLKISNDLIRGRNGVSVWIDVAKGIYQIIVGITRKTVEITHGMLKWSERSVVYIEKYATCVTLSMSLSNKLVISSIVAVVLIILIINLLVLIWPIANDFTLDHFAITFRAIAIITSGLMLQRALAINALVRPWFTFWKQCRNNSSILSCTLEMQDAYFLPYSNMIHFFCQQIARRKLLNALMQEKRLADMARRFVWFIKQTPTILSNILLLPK